MSENQFGCVVLVAGLLAYVTIVGWSALRISSLCSANEPGESECQPEAPVATTSILDDEFID